MKYNWRRWKMGLLVSAITGACTAVAVGLIVPNVTWKEAGLILAMSAAKDILLFLKQHPIESVTGLGDTEIIQKTKIQP